MVSVTTTQGSTAGRIYLWDAAADYAGGDGFLAHEREARRQRDDPGALFYGCYRCELWRYECGFVCCNNRFDGAGRGGTGSTGLVLLTTPEGSGSLGQFTFVVSDTTSPAPPDTTSPTPPDTTSPAPPDTTSPAPPDTTAKPLAFSIASFSGSVTAGESVLIWKAMNDESIAVYTIQEGADSAQLTSIATVNPQHKDSAIYVFRDPTLRSGVAWYRLLAEDTSGKQVYRASLSLSLPASTSTAYPNPANGIMQITVPNVTVASQIELADMSGKVLLVVQVSPGTNVVQINVSTINTGTYELSWSDGSRRKTQTVLIMR